MTSSTSLVTHLRFRRTRIVATVGPASREPEVLCKLVEAGVNTFRMNLSHGTHPDHAENHRRIRAVAEALGAPVGILADLCGPKIRVGTFPGGSIPLEPGADVVVTVRDVQGGPGLVPSFYRELARDVGPGSRILLDDGRLELIVESVAGTEIACKVARGGTLKDRKGMNLPGVPVSAPALTAKDRDDARFAAALGVEFIALSFVRRAEDVLELRELLREVGSDARIIAKIEKPEAVEAIEAILEASDGLMVARGDLGVELPPEEVPVVQVRLLEMGRKAGKPVIVATQMLESMVVDSRPTRAEVSDVGGAVLGGADAVMLSAETASGANPVAAVEIMDRVCREVEGFLWDRGGFGLLAGEPGTGGASLEDAVAGAIAQLSRDLMVRAIVVPEADVATAGKVSAGRPQAPVVVIGTSSAELRRWALNWGVVPVLAGSAGPSAPAAVARSLGLAGPGDRILEVSGFGPATAPAIRVVTLA